MGTIAGEKIEFAEKGYPQPTAGSAGVKSQVAGGLTTVSGVAGATGGVGSGNLIQSDIDQELFKFKSDDTPLMQLMLKAKKVKVKSPVVKHYMIDEPRSNFMTSAACGGGTLTQTVLPLSSNDQNIPQDSVTLLVKGINGYDESGQQATPGKDLMLFVTGRDAMSGNPIVRAVNGPKSASDDENCQVPEIPKGTRIIIMANALYETQKEVAPDLIVPQPTEVYLQKRGMNQIVSDYYEAQKKEIPFSKALIAEAAITDFKVRGNRTLYAGRKARIKVRTPKVGMQDIYFSEGVRYQVRKELKHAGKWTIEDIIALAKMIFTGEDVPKSVVWLAGKNLMENIQTIDYRNHPEIQITSKKNETAGWTVTNFHTVFGDFEIKHDPTLDRLLWSNSGLIVDPSRLVHYQYSAEHSSSDRIEGEEASRESILVWDALALKGSCHIWVNGEGDDEPSTADAYHFWDSATSPESPSDGDIYYLLQDCPGMGTGAMKGEMWQASVSGSTVTWKEYGGLVVNP